MNLIWNNNIEAFKKRFPALADFCLKNYSFSETEPPLKIEQAKNGELTASYNNIRLHSGYNPGREAQTIISTADKQISEKGTTVFYGFGLGYQVFEWVKKHSEKKLILIEPDIKRFLFILSVIDWQKVFNHQQLILALGCPTDQIIPLMENPLEVNVGNTGVSDAYFYDSPAFTAHAAPYFDSIKTLVNRNLQKNKINEATLNKFGKLWIKNSLKNLNQMKELASISAFQNKCHMPFIIVGAGPSLQELIPYLKQLKNRAVIVCVETALHTLLRNKIEPDFIILLDSQYWAYKHIAGLKAKKSILITDIAVYPSVFRFECKQIILCDSQFCFGQYFQNKLNISFGDLGTGGSVACSAWNFARFCGASSIYLAGVDLGFPKKQTHIRGSSAEQNYHKISNRFQSSDKFTTATLYSAVATTEQDYFKNPVITDSRMKMFAWWFESKIAAYPEPKTYTLCPQGLNIPGITPVAISEFLKLPEIISDKETIFAKDIFNNLTDSEKNNFDKLQQDFPNKTDFFEKYSFLKRFFS